MLEMPEPWDTFWGKLLPENGTSPRERSVLQSTELKGVGDLKSVLTSDMEMQSLEFSQLGFGLALVQYFLTMLPSLCFGMVMYIHISYVGSMWSAFILIVQGIAIKRLHESQKRL